MSDHKRLRPGDFVLSINELNLGEDGHTLRSGVIVAIGPDVSSNDGHFGCNKRMLVLWSDAMSTLGFECECGLMVPLNVGT